MIKPASLSPISTPIRLPSWRVAAPQPASPPQVPSVADHARRRLERSAYLSLRSLECDEIDGVLVISGRVPTFYLKQMVNALIADLAEVRNEISVAWPQPRRPRVPS